MPAVLPVNGGQPFHRLNCCVSLSRRGFLTAMTDKENVLTGLRAGAADFLTKPIDLDILMAKIAGCVMQIENNKKTGRAF
ncbi:Nitrogen regulation protein NR(I) (plasmid) [Sinorhizobium sojae CCBAU 05684]|uniref:Nitrogen regulation protein NR(I) n=1 Tax=Sinorhizobium sojae CCBAU 05684 TaxID=716928 RepID=A0A249PGR9_9HYPH|nr:response regulator transcription factor [Sinorhizobium sojae]ASY65150.1 Nitrogen regulation protein NR(I) [Sinorhizobium sojae CCBAU 05684]